MSTDMEAESERWRQEVAELQRGVGRLKAELRTRTAALTNARSAHPRPPASVYHVGRRSCDKTGVLCSYEFKIVHMDLELFNTIHMN